MGLVLKTEPACVTPMSLGTGLAPTVLDARMIGGALFAMRLAQS